MNTKAAIKALQFLCLPTLSLLVVIYVGFFNWDKFVGFVASDDPGAIFFRVGTFIAEIILVIYMYLHYDKIIPNETKINKLHKDITNNKLHTYHKSNRKSGNVSNFDINRNDEEALKTGLPIPEDRNDDYTLEYSKVDGVHDCVIVKLVRL